MIYCLTIKINSQEKSNKFMLIARFLCHVYDTNAKILLRFV